MSGPALLVAPVLAVEAVVLAWALRAGHIARIWEVLRGLLRAPHRRPLPVPQGPRLALKAPNPKPGQCPVCSLEDLDERAADDAFMGDTGTPPARVVPYGPDRAHSECAAVVPYAAPAKPTERCAAIPTDDGRVMCLAHNQGDPRCTVYPPPEPKPGKPRESARTKGGHIAANVTAAEMGPLPEVLTRPALGAHHHFGFYTPGPGATWTYCGCEEMREPPTGPIA